MNCNEVETATLGEILEAGYGIGIAKKQGTDCTFILAMSCDYTGLTETLEIIGIRSDGVKGVRACDLTLLYCRCQFARYNRIRMEISDCQGLAMQYHGQGRIREIMVVISTALGLAACLAAPSGAVGVDYKKAFDLVTSTADQLEQLEREYAIRKSNFG